MSTLKRKQIRFSAQEDINLLKEVLAQNPFHTKNWTSVAEKVSQSSDRENFTIDARRARERTSLLTDQFKTEDGEALKRSGCDEEITEKKQLLQEIMDLQEEESKAKGAAKDKAEQKAKEIRKRALESLTPKKDGNNDDELQGVTPTKRSTSASVMSYLQEKIATEKKIKEDEVELRKEELSLQKERFQLERNERLQKLENDRQQNTLMMELLKQLVKK